MDRLLKRGDVFTSKKLKRCQHEVSWSKDGLPTIDRHKITTSDEFSGAKIIYTKTETKAGGWSRITKESLDATAPDYSKTKFRVVSTAMTGGGTGHGPGDVYPDGHHVTAESINGVLLLTFYQDGCFRGMIEPRDIDLVNDHIEKVAARR